MLKNVLFSIFAALSLAACVTDGQQPSAAAPAVPTPQAGTPSSALLAVGEVWRGKTHLDEGAACATAVRDYAFTGLPGGKIHVWNEGDLNTTAEPVMKDGITTFGFNGLSGWLDVSIQNGHWTMTNSYKCKYSLRKA